MSGEAVKNVERTDLICSSRSTAFAAAGFGARQNQNTGKFSKNEFKSVATAVLKHVEISRQRQKLARWWREFLLVCC
jgi:hypothetical protein